MLDRKATLKLTSVLLALPLIAFADVNTYQNNQAQALQNAAARFDMNKIQEQQQQINQDNALAARIYDVTGIPSWRSLAFIRNSRTDQGVNEQLLINELDNYLIQNNHNKTTKLQKHIIERYCLQFSNLKK